MLGKFVLIALVWTIIVLLGYINKLKKAYFNLKNERLEKEAAAKKAIEILEEADKKTEVVNNSSKVEEVEADHEEEFEIINRCIELKGKFGTYKIENRVMTVNEELAFTDVEEIKDWANLEREELLKKIAIITAKEEEAIKAINRYM